METLKNNETKKEFALEIVKRLKKEHPEPKTDLNFKKDNGMQLSIAVAMSAQTTDKKVNEINEKLFKKYASWEDFASADLEELRADIKGVNFHLGKADRIIRMAQMVLADFHGELPKTIAELIKLPGIARKSANVITQELWGLTEGIVVDTHITRVSNRLGFVDGKNAIKIENTLMELLPKEYWKNYSQMVVLHGRYVCKARKPDCESCVLNDICPSAFTFE